MADASRSEKDAQPPGSPPARPAVVPAVTCRDIRAAVAFYERAFGFQPAQLIEDGQGEMVHAEMRAGGGLSGEGRVMVGSQWRAEMRSPAGAGGICTQTCHVEVEGDVDAHCERARAAGAEIVAEPETQFFGQRTYRARDPEGHIWTFGQTVASPTPEEWDKAIGLRTTTFDGG